MTTHEIIASNSNKMSMLEDESVNLIITSPPYPMIEMWDEMFSEQNADIGHALVEGKGHEAFLRMHEVLNKVWEECDRVLKKGGFICINIGDATRNLDDNFQLYPNHSQIINWFFNREYSILPDIHWRKQSNAPNKFMGSGMYPAGAYVTYEHEYILVFRKGKKRIFKGDEKKLRQKSAFFWEERNVWFSDLWEIKGTIQSIAKPKTERTRNASFPIEIPLRLVNMYSAEGDVVLDPFAGMGTTNIACMISKRNSIGFEVDKEIAEMAISNMNQNVDSLNEIIKRRIEKHIDFIDSLTEDKFNKCYKNVPHGFAVKTRQEVAIEIEQLSNIARSGNRFVCHYERYSSQIDDIQLALMV